MAQACYFHSTIYQFGKDAREEVIAAFNNTFQNAAAKCWYKVEADTFVLESPTGIGGEANDVLLSVIKEYRDRETAALEASLLNDEPTTLHPAKIHRFAASQHDNLDVSQDELGSAPQVGADTAIEAHTLQKQRAQPLVRHFIRGIHASGKRLRFFHLRDLPQRLLERALLPEVGHRKIVRNGLTCRYVQPSPDGTDFVFNGRTGQLIAPSACSAVAVITSTVFIEINPSSGTTNHTNNEASARSFTFVGDRPTFRQFLAGMGDIQPEDPNYMPEPPKDAQKFRQRTDVAAIGRIRVPKEQVQLSGNEDSDDSEDEKSASGSEPAAIQMDFARLLRKDDDGSDADSDDGENATAPEFQNEKGSPSFRSLFADSKQETSRMPPAVAAPSPSVTSCSNRVQETIPQRSTADCGITHLDKSDISDSYFPNTSRFARIDKMGLTSAAPSHVEWEQGNWSPRQPKPSRSGIARRSALSTGESLPSGMQSEVMSINEITNGSEYAKTPLVTSAYSHPPQPDTFDAQPTWTNHIYRQLPAVGELVDVEASDLPSSFIKPPPGYDYQARMAAASAARGRSRAQQPVNLLDDGSLYNEPMSSIPSLQPAQAPRVPQRSNQNTAPRTQDSLKRDVLLFERKADDSPTGSVKKNTMRQKAAKKGKGNAASNKTGSQRGKSKVELPLPDPIVPRKKDAQRKQNPPRSEPAASKNKPETTAQTEKAPKRAPPKVLPPIEGLLEYALSISHGCQLDLKAQFGLTLLTPAAKSDPLYKIVHERNTLEKRLNEASAASLKTSFYARMTTFETDIHHVLNLVSTDEISGTVEYEIRLKTTDGDVRFLRFAQDAPNNFLVFHGNTQKGTAQIHCPMHVWDAEVVIDQPVLDKELATIARPFVSSISTFPTEAPSFKCRVPPSWFVVEQVLTKRIINKNAGHGVQLRVTEVQELFLESAREGDFNLIAIVKDADAMIKEQKLWWEIELHAPNANSTAASKMEELVDRFIPELDGVGYSNEGPFVQVEIVKEPVKEIPMW